MRVSTFGIRKHRLIDEYLNHRPLERKNLGEEEYARNHQRGTQGVERGPPWICPVSPSDDHADEQAQYAEQVQNVPLVVDVPAYVSLYLAPLATNYSLA